MGLITGTLVLEPSLFPHLEVGEWEEKDAATIPVSQELWGQQWKQVCPCPLGHLQVA